MLLRRLDFILVAAKVHHSSHSLHSILNGINLNKNVKENIKNIDYVKPMLPRDGFERNSRGCINIVLFSKRLKSPHCPGCVVV